MPMSDAVLAAIITATATVCMSLLNLRFSLSRDGSTRVQTSGGKRKGRSPFALLFIIIVASVVGGFALSQWLTEGERVSQSLRERELQGGCRQRHIVATAHGSDALRLRLA